VLSLSSMEEVMGQRILSWYWDMPLCRRGDASKVKLFLRLSEACIFSDVLL
jgi:hypothetical protein